VFAYLDRIDRMGGALAAIESGFIQKEIQDAAYRYQCAVERGEVTIVGVNRFVQSERGTIPTFRVDPEAEADQVRRLREMRVRRDAGRVAARLDALESAARTGANLMPVILDAADVLATVGEISDRLRLVFGEYRDAA
jgi:methylmalonyl-CoA mutase N-terminal domain/subunit